MTYYRNKKQRLKEIDEAVNKEKILNMKMKDYEMGIVPQVLDNRTTFEKLSDDVYMYQNLREKVYDLFNNDSQSSEKYLEFLQTKNINQEDFINVYSDLKTRFKGQLATPASVFSTTKKLIENFNETGNTTSFKSSEILMALNNFKNNVIPQLSLSPKKQTEIEEKIEALELITNKDDELLTEEENIKKKATTQLRNIILSILNYDDNDEVDLQNIIKALTNTTTDIFRQYSKENDFKTRNEVIQKSFIGATDIKKLNEELNVLWSEYNEILEELNEMEGRKLNGGQQRRYRNLVRDSKDLLETINKKQKEIDKLQE